MPEPGRLGFQDPVVAAGVVRLTALYAAKTVTPLQAADIYLRRIERLNPLLNAFLFVDREGALREAEASTARWAAGLPLSPLDGVAIGIKANIAVRGLPWHAGVAAYRERIAHEDADCVMALRMAGVVILGVLNMHEAALGATTDNIAFGRSHNPYRHDFTPGGSSGGSAAAVSGGLCAAALGTDTLGSVRIPAAYCGVFGHMPPRGRLSTRGITPLSWTLDHVGVLARSAGDARAVVSVLASTESGEIAIDTLKAAVFDTSGQTDLEPDGARAFDAMIEGARTAGLRVERIRFPVDDIVAVRRLCLLVAEVEGFVEHEAALAADSQGFSPALRDMLHWGARQSAPKMATAYRQLALTAGQINAMLHGVDAVITPTARGPAFAFQQAAPADQADFTLLANVAGLAATAFPLGLGQDALPRSAEVLSRSEAVTLSLAAALAVPPPAPERFRF